MNSQTTSAPRFRQRISRGSRRDGALPQVNGSAPSKKGLRRPARRSDRFDLLPSDHSEQSREVLLQSAAGKSGDRLTVAYHSPSVEFDLSSRGKMLLAGSLECELSIDGVPLDCRGDWQSVCWHANADCDYLELRLELSESVWIDRQIVLSRRDHFALLADAVIAGGAKRIDYGMSLPLAEEAAARFDTKTREGRLVVPGRVARVFPLALPQERVHSTAGTFLEIGGRLEATHSGAGWGLYVPLFLDWHPRRRSSAAEWRSLTITELGKVVSPDRAGAHRLRLGRKQWLIYKTLNVPEDARAVLGHHTHYEAIIGGFDSSGAVDPIVMVEMDQETSYHH